MGNKTITMKQSREENEEIEEQLYRSPKTEYFITRAEFDIAVGQDFITNVNQHSKKGQRFLVGLSHGQSPSGAYQYILDNYDKIKFPERLRYTFVNSPLKRQRDLKGFTDAKVFLRELVKQKLLEKKDIIGSVLQVTNKQNYAKQYNEKFSTFLKEQHKEGLDYVFVATNPLGHVAGISRNSEIFNSTKIVEVVEDRKELEVSFTPYFLNKSKRVAFLATKSDKRRALAWLFSRSGRANQSPSFLRYIEDVENRLTVFIDDEALNWPQIQIERKTKHGISTIKIDVPKPFKETLKKKLPVILMVHGFLGLNSFDGLLTNIPSSRYIAAAMHYGSVPEKLTVERYSKHVVNNIDAAVNYFGELGHQVYLLDHSMGNIYFMMINRDLSKLKGIQKHLKGRMGFNPFFGIECKHALLGFMDNVIIPSISIVKNPIEKTMFLSMRSVLPIDSKKGVRKRGITLSDMLIRKDSNMRDRVWKSVKSRILFLMTNMDSLPQVNRIPIERALNRLPAKLFVIQIYSALLESISFDQQKGFENFNKHGIPILIFKSDKDCIAKFVPQYHEGENIEVIDVTNVKEKDLFREHLYHMVKTEESIKEIDRFISEVEIVNQ